MGCSSKEEQALKEYHSQNKIYNKKLQKTEKIQLYSADEKVTKVLVTATYLNKQKVKKQQKEDEIFILGVYIEKSEFEDFDTEAFSLTLDGKKYKSITPLETDSPYLKNISFLTPWSQFYLVHFPYTAKKSFDLIFNSAFYGEGKLHFAKVAKYVLKKKPF